MLLFWSILTVCCFVATSLPSETSKFDFVMKELDSLRHDFQVKYERLEAENTNLKRELASVKSKRLLLGNTNGSETTIGFYARRRQNGVLGVQQTIEFDHVHENHGNGYDPRHGHFIAPISGLYEFSTTILAGSDNGIHCEMVKNGQNIGQLVAARHYSTSTLNVVIYLNVGDMVWVRHFTATPQQLFASDYSTFSGFLISV
ncbi:complement C1q-like protein 4 isoform X2 [Mytilus edulis]|uniref:complement C1q-like protein 4 isoform X2 n=1 Tax=Mytilus edulis TaxID=6550 RepID=UPI0039F034D8